MRALSTAALALAMMFGPGLRGVALANSWDLNLSRLCRIEAADGTLLDCGRPHDFSQHGGLANDPIKPDHESFRSLMSELAVIFAPDLQSPAETVGFGGYHLSAEIGFTTINPKREANRTDSGLRHRYWRAAESVGDAAFRQGSDTRSSEAKQAIDSQLPSSFAPTITVMARKGFWFPVPSIELGAGVKHLIDSRMWAAIVTAKLALHEGFQGWPLPAVAIRGTGTRVFGTADFDLTMAGMDLSISKAFGVASAFSLTPYLGYQMLWIIADSGTLDAMPYQKATELSNSRHFTFLPQSQIFRHRVLAGARVRFHIVSVLAQFSYFVHGMDDDRIDSPTLRTVEVEDRAGAQFAFNCSVGVDF